jgi:hypothetical protein
VHEPAAHIQRDLADSVKDQECERPCPLDCHGGFADHGLALLFLQFGRICGIADDERKLFDIAPARYYDPANLQQLSCETRPLAMDEMEATSIDVVKVSSMALGECDSSLFGATKCLPVSGCTIIESTAEKSDKILLAIMSRVQLIAVAIFGSTGPHALAHCSPPRPFFPL